MCNCEKDEYCSYCGTDKNDKIGGQDNGNGCIGCKPCNE